ncbi:hypothetical protein GE061_016429 [Apolygus lucorum]|uniref:Uncharacterized protein n=1 Tax=Apolygus lucorum TaxID=248454 RepID=A0A6A4K5I1_APOLU|nr:hypothetical protein GE061_016429 [Apolygus lucorum]
MDEDEERLWFRVRRAEGGNRAVILGDGDNVALHAVPRNEIPFIAETGGGDMTDQNNRRAWIQRRNNLRIRTTIVAAVTISLCAAVMSGMAIRRCFDRAAYKLEIYEAIDRGYISSQYIHVMNEGLYLIRHKRESDLLQRIRKLNEAYKELWENIREVMKTLSEKDKKAKPGEDL